MPKQRRWLGLLLPAAIAVVAGVAGTARADEDDPELSAPSLCAPPCPDGQICAGNRCVVPGRRPAAPPPRRATTPPPPPPAPAGSVSTTGPPPAAPPHPGSTPPPAAPPPPYPPPQPYPPPPPGYAPPPGTAQPLGWYYPPPQPYVQPLGYYYPPPPPPPTPGRLKRRFLALPYLGMHSYQDRLAELYGPGLRVGTLMGVRTSDRFSLNGELTFNFSNVSGTLSNFREYSVDLAIAPLFQMPAGPIEIALGPKLGFFIIDTENPATGGGTSFSQNGIVLGVNTGIFVPVSATTSMGVLLAFELRRTYQICYNDSIGNESCMSVSGADFISLVGLTAAVLF